MHSDNHLIWESYIQKEGLASGVGKQAAGTSGLDKSTIDRMDKWDKIQFGFDVAGLDPTMTVGTVADGANVAISLTRGLGSALKGERDEVKRHAINAAISSLSLIPFGDVAKVLKLKTLAKAGGAKAKVAKAGMGALRTAKNIAGTGKISKAAGRAKLGIARGAARAGKAGTKGYEDEEGPVIDIPGTVEPEQPKANTFRRSADYRNRLGRKNV